MLTFREYINNKMAPQNVDMRNPDRNVDDEIVNNPNLLQPPPKPGADMITQRKVIDQAIQKRRQNRGVSLDAAVKAASISNKRLN